MKKNLFSTFVCLLLCALFLLAPVKFEPVKAAESENPFSHATLYFDDQVDIGLVFNPDLIDGSFSVTTDFNPGKTYTARDLVELNQNGENFKVLQIGPFTAKEYNKSFTFEGTGIGSLTLSPVDIAISYLEVFEKPDYAENNQDLIAFLKAFVNYGVAADNLANNKDNMLYYDIAPTDPGFTANPGEGPIKDKDGKTVIGKNYLGPQRSLSGRSFTLSDDVYLKYVGELKSTDNIRNWTVTVNTVDATDSLTAGSDSFSFRVPVLAQQGAEKLRIIIRDNSITDNKTTAEEENVLFDCTDRADAAALELGKNFPDYKELSDALAAYLQAASNYYYSTELTLPYMEDDTFYAGYSRVDITPYGDAVMMGDSEDKRANEFIEPIAVTCVALRGTGGEISLIFSLDIRNLQSLRTQVYQRIRDDVCAVTGIPADHIFFNATHNHSAPSVSSSDASVTVWYNEYFYPRVPVAAKKALEDLTEVTSVSTAKANAANSTNENRRFDAVSGREDKADKEIRTIRFERSAGKAIYLVNWQAHAAHATGYTPKKGNADFVGILRNRLESEQDVHLIYINGASGDLNFDSSNHSAYINDTNSVVTTINRMASSETTVSVDEIKFKKTNIHADIHYRFHLDENKEIVKNADGSIKYCYDSRCTTCASDYQIVSSVSSWDRLSDEVSPIKFYSSSQYNQFKDQKNNSNLNVHVPNIDLWTMTIGDKIGFAFTPYEMFNQNGVALRNALGSDKTIITAGYTNGYLGYMPSEVAWANVDDMGGKDTGVNEVHSTGFVRGTAERCIDQLTTDLTSLFN